MHYEGVSNDLPIEAIVAHNLGDEDWEDLCTDPRLAEGCFRAAPLNSERDERFGRFEAEPITIKALVTRRPRT